jgi:hypothetical protein
VTASSEPMLAAGPAARDELAVGEIEDIRRRFAREGQLAAEAWIAFRESFANVLKTHAAIRADDRAGVAAFGASWAHLLRGLHEEGPR